MPIAIQSDLALLSLSLPVTQDQVKRAYRIMAKKWHPDRHPPAGREVAAKKMAAINHAKDRIDQYLAKNPAMGVSAAPSRGAQEPRRAGTQASRSASSGWWRQQEESELAAARRIFEEQMARVKAKEDAEARVKMDAEMHGFDRLLRTIRKRPSAGE